MLEIGKKAPEFSLQSDSDEKVSLKDFRGKKVILYFYPKDETPGCTQEACDFEANSQKIKKKNAVIIGISRDSVTSHQKFKARQNLSFILLADTDSVVCDLYEVIVDKTLYGKQYRGIERSTFLIDEDGKIEKIWRKVKVNGHALDVLEQL
jgi:thioredoxin-dependent peroxiredoxin